MGKKRLYIKQTEGGCFVPTTHKLNHDGYFRRDIGNRACCNLAHLQCIHGSEHAAKTNRERAKRRPM